MNAENPVQTGLSGVSATRTKDTRLAEHTGGYSRAPLAAGPWAVGLTPVPGSCSRGGTLRPPRSSRGKEVPQPLCPGLADVQLSADRAHRGNPVRRELRGEQLGRLLLQRVRVASGPGRARRRTWELRMTIMRSSHEPTSATAGHAATQAPTTPWPRPWATLAASVAAMPRPRSHRASAGTGVLRRAESSMTIELA
jgi:hypothetical protein